MIKSWKISLIHSGKFLIFVSLLCFGFLKWQVVHSSGLKNDAMAKSIKSGFCSLHLFLQYIQVLCSWNLCNQPNYRTSFKSLKLGFAMGSLAEKLIHFVTKRSIHEFFSQLLTSLNFVAICKGGLIMYLLLLKINIPNLKCRSYWLSYFIIFHPLFCPFSC